MPVYHGGGVSMGHNGWEPADVNNDSGRVPHASFSTWWHRESQSLLLQLWDMEWGWYWGLRYTDGTHEVIRQHAVKPEAKQPYVTGQVLIAANVLIQRKAKRSA